MIKTFMSRALAGEIIDYEGEYSSEMLALSAYSEKYPDQIGMLPHIWLGLTWQEYATLLKGKSIQEIVKDRQTVI